MFSGCADPSSLSGLDWTLCYLSTGKHLLFYWSFVVVLGLMLVTAPLALMFGFGGAVAARSRVLPLRLFGKAYTSMVRGVPDIIFFLFVPIAFDQGIEWLRHKAFCPEWTEPIRQGSDFVVCAAAKMPLSTAPAWVHQTYGLAVAVLAFSVVFGAFTANVLYGAMNAVPKAQLETAEAYGLSHPQIFRRILVPQMWLYALPGLSNLWLILIKATPLLFLLGVQDIVYWARELGGTKTSAFAYPHGDWRLFYFAGLLLFYLGMTKISEVYLGRLTRNLTRGQATIGGEAMRKAAT